jgi:hypothetical protein
MKRSRGIVRGGCASRRVEARVARREAAGGAHRAELEAIHHQGVGAAREIRQQVAGIGTKHEIVRTGAAGHRARAEAAAVERVVAPAAGQGVEVLVPIERVVAKAAGEGVLLHAAEDRVVAVAAIRAHAPAAARVDQVGERVALVTRNPPVLSRVSWTSRFSKPAPSVQSILRMRTVSTPLASASWSPGSSTQ